MQIKEPEYVPRSYTYTEYPYVKKRAVDAAPIAGQADITIYYAAASWRHAAEALAQPLILRSKRYYTSAWRTMGYHAAGILHTGIATPVAEAAPKDFRSTLCIQVGNVSRNYEGSKASL